MKKKAKNIAMTQFGRLQINPETSNARFYLRAYGDPEVRASWKDLTVDEADDIHTRRTKYFEKFERVLVSLIHTANGVEDPAYRETILAKHARMRKKLNDRLVAWWKFEANIIHAKNAAEARKRFEEGRLSLCPYFHSLWYAMLWLNVLIPTGKKLARANAAFWKMAGKKGEWAFEKTSTIVKWTWHQLVARPFNAVDNAVGKFLENHKTAVETCSKIVTGLSAVIGVSVFLAGLWFGGAFVVGNVQSWRAEQAAIEQQNARNAEYERNLLEEYRANLKKQQKLNAAEELRLAPIRAAKQLAEAKEAEELRLAREAEQKEALADKLLYEKEHPEEVAAQRKAEAEEAEHRAYNNSIWEIRVRMDGVKQGIRERQQNIGVLIGIAKFIGAILLSTGIWLLGAFTLDFAALRWQRFTQTELFVRMNTWRAKKAAQIHAIGVVIKETWQLIVQFAKASYRGICPLIEFKKPDEV